MNDLFNTLMSRQMSGNGVFGGSSPAYQRPWTPRSPIAMPKSPYTSTPAPTASTPEGGYGYGKPGMSFGPGSAPAYGTGGPSYGAGPTMSTGLWNPQTQPTNAVPTQKPNALPVKGQTPSLGYNPNGAQLL